MEGSLAISMLNHRHFDRSISKPTFDVCHTVPHIKRDKSRKMHDDGELLPTASVTTVQAIDSME